MEKVRCKWCNLKNDVYVKYHDEEWCVPSYDDKYLFEMLVLESFQAGLSWECVLNKRKYFEERPELVDEILIKGTEKARATAKETMKKVKKAMKLDYFE